MHQLQDVIVNFDGMYEYPIDEDFHHLKFIEIDWPNARSSNFFNILRVLTIRGKLSLPSLANLHVDGDHDYNNVFQTIYRILNGSKDGSNRSLQVKGLVKKTGRLFELTPLGVLYAIHVFHMDKYYDDEHTKFEDTRDYSYQKNITGIFDLIKKHYNYFPMFFDNLDYIKENENLDINNFFDILSSDASLTFEHPFYIFHHDSVMSFPLKVEQIIPFIFYHGSAIDQILHIKKPFKFTDPVRSELAKISNKMSKTMKDNLELYSSFNSDLFG